MDQSKSQLTPGQAKASLAEFAKRHAKSPRGRMTAAWLKTAQQIRPEDEVRIVR